jgi:PucR C-terminal helix-turn-helix domain/GGDEF-like domain
MVAPPAAAAPEVTERDVAQRRRLLMSLLEDVDALAARGAAAMRAELPAYAARDERFDADVLDQTRRNTIAILEAMVDGRESTAADHAFQRSAAMRRARSGFALEDYLSAYRVGHKVMWDAIAAEAEEQQVSRRVVFWLASHLMHHIDYAAAHAARSYVDFRQHGLADAARERRDLLEHLLEGRLPETGVLAAAAERYGIGARTPALVAVAVSLATDEGPDGPALASSSLSRAGLNEMSSLVVVRHSEIVAVMTVGGDHDPEPVIVGMERAQQRLRADGVPLAIGVSATAEAIAELPQAYQEALTALRFVGKDGGVAALTRLSSFQYLALCADSTAQRLQDPRLARFLRDDRGRGGILIATIRAYADADMSLKDAASHLHVHPNTAQYRFQRIEELCGLNPRRFGDLHTLVVAIAIDDARPLVDDHS